MPFEKRLAEGIAAFEQAQKIRAWALVTGLIAAAYAVGVTILASPVLFQSPNLETVVMFLWAGGALVGAASLIAKGTMRSQTQLQRRIVDIGLWIGNFVVSGNILVFPIVFPLALVPVIGGFVALKQRSNVHALAFLSLPFIAVGSQALNWALEFPLGAS